MEEKVYIEMEEVIDTIRYRVCQGNGNEEHICKRGSCAYCGIMEIISDIYSISAANIQPVKHGQWILHTKRIVDVDIKLPTECSECGFEEFSAEKYNFCPKCGAKMEVKE